MEKKSDVSIEQEENSHLNKKIHDKSNSVTVKQEQIHNLLFSKEIGWQEVIYDLINTNQLNPWDIDITLLANSYLEKIQKLEEQSFFISSKVLLAAALLLRIKSEILLNEYVKSIDEILFGKKEKIKAQERLYLEDEIPELIPKTPIPRFRRITLKELVESLDKAIITESRRIKRAVIEKSAVRESALAIHKKRFSIKYKVNEIYEKILENLKEKDKIYFKKLSGENREEKIITFSSLLHLENQRKIWIEQNENFGEIYIWLKKTYLKNNDPFADLREEN